jgi:pilus assembly protein FimV
MIITCEECKTSYNLNESLLQPSGSKVRCTSCKHVFTAFPPPDKAPEMVRAEPVVDTQLGTPSPQPSNESDALGGDDLFDEDKQDSYRQDLAMGAGDGDDFDLAGEDFDLPGNDMDLLDGAEPTEEDLKLTDEDLDLVMNMAPAAVAATATESAPSMDGQTAAAATDLKEPDNFLEDLPAESAAAPEPSGASEDDLDLDLELDFGEDDETQLPETASAPNLEGADELDLDLDLDLDLEEDEKVADRVDTGEEATLDLDEELSLTDSLELDDGDNHDTAAEAIPDEELATEDEIGLEELDLELELDEEGGTATTDAAAITDAAASAGIKSELDLELEDDGGEVAGDADGDLDLDLDFDLDEAPSEPSDMQSPQEEGDALLELDLEDDVDASGDQDIDDGLSLELDNLDLMDDGADAVADTASSDEDLDFDLDGDLELSLEDDADAADTAVADGSGEDDLDLADLEGLLDEEVADLAQTTSEKVRPKEDDLFGDDDLGLTSDLESILDEDDGDSAPAFSLDEEPELDLDLENQETASGSDDSLDLSDFEYLAEDGEKAPSDAHFDSGDMELEFEVDEEGASALEEADAQLTPPKQPAEKRAEPEIVPEAAAAAKAPAGPTPVPKKRGTSKLLIAVLIIILLLGGGYCAYVLLDGMGIRIPYLSDYLKPEANDPGNLQMTTFDINSRFVDSQTLGRIFVITGKVKNGYDHPRGFVQLTGKLFTKGKKLSSSQTVYAGNLISDMDLVNLNADELNKRLNNRFGNNRINSRVQPGKSLPFMVVFAGLPEAQLEEFTIEVDTSTALK